MSRPVSRSLALLALAKGALACASVTPAPQAAPVAEPAAPPPPEVDAHRLCEVIREVEDAAYLGRRAAIQAQFDRDLEANPDDREAAFAALYAIENENARWKAFRKDAAAHPESAIGPLGECFVYAQWKVNDQARVPCEAAQTRLEGAAVVDLALAWMAQRQGRPEEAVSRYRTALDKDPGCTPARAGLARAHEAAGAIDDALAEWKSAIDESPDCFSCAAERAALLERTQGATAALPDLDVALAIVPDHLPTLQRYAAALVGTDDARALAAYEQAIAHGAITPSTLWPAAQLAKGAGQIDKALAYGEQTSQADPSSPEVWRFLATLYKERGEEAGVERASLEVIRLSPNDPEAHLAVAVAAKAQGRFVAALEHLEIAAASVRAEGGDPAWEAPVQSEVDAFLRELGVDPAGVKGNIDRVLGVVERQGRKAFEAQKAQAPDLKGQVDLVVVTDPSGRVTDVKVRRDTLGNQRVAATLSAWFRRATIEGGAKRYALELEFE